MRKIYTRLSHFLVRKNPLSDQDWMSPLIQKDVAKASELIERLKR